MDMLDPEGLKLYTVPADPPINHPPMPSASGLCRTCQNLISKRIKVDNTYNGIPVSTPTPPLFLLGGPKRVIIFPTLPMNLDYP
jgi:hypothetical protein